MIPNPYETRAARTELDRLINKAAHHPPSTTAHWFSLLPEGSRELLAYMAFEAIAREAQALATLTPPR